MSIKFRQYTTVNQTVNKIAIELLSNCFNVRPFLLFNLDPMYDEKPEKRKQSMA